MASIDDLKTWWTGNSWMMDEHWDEYLELGSLIKALADDANAEALAEEPSERPYRYIAPPLVVEVPPGHFDRGVQLPVAPFGLEDFGTPRTPELRKRLDPLPYVQYEGSTIEQRYSASDPARVHGRFKPRSGFEEDETRYSFTSRSRYRNGGV